MSRETYYFCTKCCNEASTSCLLHKQLIQKFQPSEIKHLPIRRRYQCKFCFKLGFTTDRNIKCYFCKSTNIKLVWNSSGSIFEFNICGQYSGQLKSNELGCGLENKTGAILGQIVNLNYGSRKSRDSNKILRGEVHWGKTSVCNRTDNIRNWWNWRRKRKTSKNDPKP